jgi:hypothetical protein
MKRFSFADDRVPFRAQVRHHHRSGSRPPAWQQWIDERPRRKTARRWFFRLSVVLVSLTALGALIAGFISSGLV